MTRAQSPNCVKQGYTQALHALALSALAAILSVYGGATVRLERSDVGLRLPSSPQTAPPPAQ
jgi:hypothetical protein